MFIAMNRFKVNPERAADFERVWLERETHLDKLPGFIVFHLLRGPKREDHVLYSSHTVWQSEADFVAWTQSEAFRASHRGAGDNKGIYLGHPEFEGFTVIQEVNSTGGARLAAAE